MQAMPLVRRLEQFCCRGQPGPNPMAAPPLNRPMYENLSRLAIVTDAVCMPPMERPAIAR